MICDAKWDDLKTTTPKQRRHKETYIYDFPPDDILKMNFETYEEINIYLLRMAHSIGFFQSPMFEKQIKKENGLQCCQFMCNRRGCRAHLQCHRVGTLIYINKLASRHSHRIRLTPTKARILKINQYLMDIPPQDNIDHHLEAMRCKFNLSKQQTKYWKSKIFWKLDNDEDLLEKLTERNIAFRRDDQNEILLICSQTMKKNYEIYGDMLCFDITYKLLKKKKGQNKHTGVGFFIGQDENTRILIFGMNTIGSESSHNFERLFSFFFQCMDNKLPFTILTDEQKALETALQNLKNRNKYHYFHLLDWYHKIQNFMKKLKREKYKQILLPLFNKFHKEPSKYLFNDIIQEIAKYLNRKETMIDFLKEKSKYCLSQVPCTFFGFGVSSTRAESMNNLIKRYVSHQTNMGKLIFFVLKVERRLLKNTSILQKMNPELLTFINDPQLLKLHEFLQYNAFDQIKKYYEQSLEHNLRIIDCLNVEIPYIKYDRSYKFKLKYDIQRCQWVCQCCAIYKTGMPCIHIVKVIRHFGGCIGYYINERWFHNKDGSYGFKYSRPAIARNRARI